MRPDRRHLVGQRKETALWLTDEEQDCLTVILGQCFDEWVQERDTSEERDAQYHSLITMQAKLVDITKRRRRTTAR